MSNPDTRTLTIYGIKSCDTMKKAVTWLEANGLEYDFHDYKKQGIDSARLQTWLKQIPWDTLINKRGTTWRKLPDTSKKAVEEAIDDEKAIALMMDTPSLIKRPVLVYGDHIEVGFKPENYEALLAQ